MKPRKPIRVIGCIVLVLGAVLLAVGGLLSLYRSQTSSDEVIMRATSPDGEIVATGRGFESIGHGYHYVTLELAHGGFFGGRPQQVVEFVFENLYDLRWRDSRTLVVRYSFDEELGPSQKDQFVQCPDRWRDVRIVYERMKP